ncbi:hypothetical protein [Salarchaeum sp. JOR-1]|uniref:hypothetical protein n=1 Tax=Salarchaeum sp. JOR-1 TaxID=2599399 RepID=UPI001198C980|nr:hypothetical protein [Salarchaeum sp. JOR-1]QDX41156.1 hypothetical protein FQU85_09675 [Salarchaeum sp. JOR-1]
MNLSEYSDSAGFVPDSDDVASVFRRHFSNYEDTSGEVSYQQLQNEESIRRQYSGRVLFELLQNALDRADSKVTVEIREVAWEATDYALVVGNDGTPIRVNPEYDYGNPPETSDDRRPDFNALCSLHTSNKLPEESVGNKGIGFRSVFWLGDFVRVWSQFAHRSGWWGLEMHSPLDRATWTTRLEVPEVRAGHQTYLGNIDVQVGEEDRRPSFHFPLPLDAEQPPTPADLHGLNTVVVVPILEPRIDELRESVEAIQQGHLNFVGLFEDRQNLSVQFETPWQSFTKGTWPEHDTEAGQDSLSISHWKTDSEPLVALAKEAEHELSAPGAAVAWPTDPSLDAGESSGSSQSRVYGYLPTLISSPFGIDVQGDFQLRTDRTSLRLDDETIGAYNEALLEVAAEIHLNKVLADVGVSSDVIEWDWIEPTAVQTASGEESPTSPRPDLWQFLDPATSQSEAGEIIVDHLESLLFLSDNSQDVERYQQWSVLATAFFDAREQWPVQTYRDFWTASKGWIDRACKYSSSTKTWRTTAAAMGDALRDHRGRVAPVTAQKELPPDEDVPAVPLPERSEADATVGRGERHTRRLFLRRSEETDLELPRALREANRAVTSFDFPPGFRSEESPQPLGASQFNRWEVLRELRQLPHDLDTWTYSPLAEDTEEAAELQSDLIQFAMNLYALDSQGGTVSPAESDEYGPGWRALRNHVYSENARTAGRSIATLFLPTTAGKWEPARQLTLDRVATNRLPSPPADVDLDDFLLFLGVTPAPPEDGVPLTLVEGGDNGIVTETPPALSTAGSQWSPLQFGEEPRQDDDEEPTAWVQSLDAAWEWLEELITAERLEMETSEGGGRRPLELIPQLRDNAWFPVGGTDSEGDVVAEPPVIIEDPPTQIPPAKVTLVSGQQRQLPPVLWSLSKEAPIESELLTALGAVPGTDMDSLSKNNAEPAFRLLEQLHELTAPMLSVIEETPRARQALRQLVDRLLNTIAREHESEEEELDIPLLVYQGVPDKRALSDRPLKWTDSDGVWIPTDTVERERMRRFFPDVPLVTAIIGRDTLTGYAPLNDLAFEITRHVHPIHQGSQDGIAVETLDAKIEEVVPHLLALAETTTQVDVDPAEAANRWRSRVIRHVDDAWVEFEAMLGDETRRSDPQFKGDYNHALFLQDTPPTIIFDTPEGQEGPPPLDEFGEPLVELLLEENRGGVGSSFAHVLGAFESGGTDRVERILEKHDAMSLVEAYDRHLRQLDDDEYAALRDRIREALGALGLELRDSWTRLSHIGPEDIAMSSAPGDVTHQDVEETLRGLELTDEQEPFRPHFSCVEHHRADWEGWYSSWENRLCAYLQHLIEAHTGLAISESEIANHLDKYVRETACQRVVFDPKVAVIEWLRRDPFGASIPSAEIPDADELETKLREFSPRYDPVEEVVTSDEVGLARPEVEQSSPNETGSGIVELEDLEAEWEQTKAVGDEAEQAALSWITERTARYLDQAAENGDFATVSDALVSAIPGSGKSVETLQTALREWEETRDSEVLERGLHISRTWDGAGYDLIGLKETASGFEPVRYEVKSLPEDETGFKIHLTRNQLSVYRKVRLENDADQDPLYGGDWKLLGVKPDRRAIDLTNELEELPSRLRPLQTEGYDHDGLLIYIDTS